MVPALKMVEAIASILMERGYSLAVAESCTGGLLGATLTELSGSSRWFKGGVIAYSNELKERLLNVPPEVLNTHGAVSEPAASAMAEGVQAATGAHVTIAITGIAGPTGGSPQKPVGTVFLAIKCCGASPCVVRLSLDGSRRAIREQTVHKALELLHRRLSEELGIGKD